MDLGARMLRLVVPSLLVACGSTPTEPVQEAPRDEAPSEPEPTAFEPTGRRLAAGFQHACGLTRSGAVHCWGEMPLLDTGHGGPEPATLEGLGPARSIAVGLGTGCLVLGDGSGECWGLAPPPPDEGPWPEEARIRYEGPLRSIVVDEVHGCTVGEDGSLRCFELGNPTTSRVAIDARVTDVSIATGHRCALTEDGEVFCWGSNISGELGDGTEESREAPTRVMGLTDAVRVGVGSEFSCALRANGEVVCWGANRSSQLGLPPSEVQARSVPGAVPGLPPATDLVVGRSQTCALDAEGVLRCWGYNAGGQLGDGSTNERHEPRPVAGLPPVVEASLPGSYGCALDREDQVWCWGTARNGQLGITTESGAIVEIPNVRADRVFATEGATCVLVGEELSCCGLTGDGVDARARLRPVALPRPTELTSLAGAGPLVWARWGDRLQSFMVRGDEVQARPEQRVSALSTQRLYSCIVERGRVRCRHFTGAPTTLPGVSDAIDVDIGSDLCAVRRSGDVVCWGDDRSVPPEPVADLSDAVEVISRPGPCVRTRDGRVVCTGAGEWPIRNVSALQRGDAHLCALSEGRVYCAGANLSGQLGPGADYEVGLAAPREVPGITDAVELVVGSGHSCVRRRDGRVACWGSNNDGQLGGGPEGFRPRPAVVTSLR